MRNIIFSFTIIFLLSSCNFLFQPLTLDLKVPNGPPEYQAGWHDGCSSALSFGGFHASKFHKLTMGDGTYQHDQTYQNAWGSGWFACATQSGDYTAFPGIGTAPFE
ncbi:MAG: hypothetical protein V4612_04830 [Pseudomonadota bacterium]